MKRVLLLTRERRSRLGAADHTSRHPFRSTMIVPRLRILVIAVAALASIALILVASGKSAVAFTSLVNGNFETGDLSGWTADTTSFDGAVGAVASYDYYYQVSCTPENSYGGPCYDVQSMLPKEGSYFALLRAGQPSEYTKLLSKPFKASNGDKVSGWAFFETQQNLYNPNTGENDDKGQVVVKSASGTTVATPFQQSVSSVAYGLSSGWKYWEYTFTDLTGGEGDFQIEARVGNTLLYGLSHMGLDDVKTSIAGPDTTLPETYITSGPGPNGYTTSRSVTFGFSSNEKGSTFKCKLTRAGAQNPALSEVLEDWTDCTSPRTYSYLDYTYYIFQVQATDPAGNVDPTPDSRFWTSDTPGATTVFTITSPQTNTYDTDGSFSVSGRAIAGSTVELSEGTTSKGTIKTSSTGDWSIPLSGVSEGAHTYKAKATDAAGAIYFPSNSVTVTVDKTKPAGTVSLNNGASSTPTRSVTLTLSATDPSPGSGVSEMRVSNTQSGLSSASWEVYSTTKTWTLTASKGTKTVYVQYRDAAGNLSAIVTDTISV